jgi:hypothetical protein
MIFEEVNNSSTRSFPTLFFLFPYSREQGRRGVPRREHGSLDGAGSGILHVRVVVFFFLSLFLVLLLLRLGGGTLREEIEGF